MREKEIFNKCLSNRITLYFFQDIFYFVFIFNKNNKIMICFDLIITQLTQLASLSTTNCEKHLFPHYQKVKSAFSKKKYSLIKGRGLRFILISSINGKCRYNIYQLLCLHHIFNFLFTLVCYLALDFYRFRGISNLLGSFPCSGI